MNIKPTNISDEEKTRIFNESMKRQKPYVEKEPVRIGCVNQWISVEDRLPEESCDCLVWYSCDTAFGKCKSWGIAHCSRCDWYTKHLDGDNVVVLYWHPLPEPPNKT